MSESNNSRSSAYPESLRIATDALTFDDVLLQPAYSDVLPREVDMSTRLTAEITLNIPILAAAMDTVTESRLAIALAQEGGLGIIHKNMSVEEQARQVLAVKKFESGIVRNPITVSPDMTIREVLELTASMGISGVPVVSDRKTVGIVTHRDLRFETKFDAPVSSVMTPQDRLVTVREHADKDEVLSLLHKHRIEKVLVVNGNQELKGMITAKDFQALVEAGADGVKVGIGPGSICTTRVVAGVGVPQISAIAEVADALKGKGIPFIGDGGIRYSGDIAKALVAGAHSVMIGGLFAGTEESPGEVELFQGRSYKSYRGMGSIGAMGQSHGSKDRYFQDATEELEKLVPEGIEGRVAYKGSLVAIVHQLIGGVRAAMGYTGSSTIEEMRSRPKFVRITSAGMAESHVHDVTITKEAPNYRTKQGR